MKITLFPPHSIQYICLAYAKLKQIFANHLQPCRLSLPYNYGHTVLHIPYTSLPNYHPLFFADAQTTSVYSFVIPTQYSLYPICHTIHQMVLCPITIFILYILFRVLVLLAMFHFCVINHQFLSKKSLIINSPTYKFLQPEVTNTVSLIWKLKINHSKTK